jgi:UDP-N-acetylglucosamine transferase subunit ALG13
MLFLTVGTQFPFDRLVRAVDSIIDKGLIRETLFAQIGESSYKPRNFESAACLEKGVFDDYMRQASGIIGHAGMGTITMALCNHKPLLVMPRLRKYREVVNDHQLAIANKFSELGYMLAAYDTVDLPDLIRQLKSFVPRERKANPEVVADRIVRFLNNLRD